jgi:hypothetical protein
MGERTNGVSSNGVSNGHSNGAHHEPPEADKLEQRVANIREHMGDVVRELDHRRHDLMDVKGQLKKHAPVVAAVGGGVLLLAGGAIGLSMYRSRQAARTRRVVETKHTYEGILHKVVSAAAGALVGVLVKSLAEKYVKPVVAAGAAPAPALPYDEY